MGPPPRKKKLGPRIAIAVVAGLVIGLGGGFGLLQLRNSQPAASDEEGKPATPRSNVLVGAYERRPAPTVDGRVIVDACALLPPGELDKIGIPVRHPANVLHGYLDTDVEGGPSVSEGWSMSPVSGCSYAVHSDKGLPGVSVEFNAAPFTSEDNFESEVFEPRSRVRNGLTVFTGKTRTDGWAAEIPVGDREFIRVVLDEPESLPDSFGGVPTRQLFDRVVDTVVDNYRSGAVGVQGFRYEQPWGEVKSACDVFTAAAFRVATGEPDSGWVEEIIPVSEYQMLNSRVGSYMYLEQTCHRISKQRLNSTTEGAGEQVRVTYYRDAAQAAAHDDHCQMTVDIGVQDTGAKLGDGQSCVTTFQDLTTFEFRSGKLGISLTANKGEDPRAFRDRAVPVAQQILRDLNG